MGQIGWGITVYLLCLPFFHRRMFSRWLLLQIVVRHVCVALGVRLITGYVIDRRRREFEFSIIGMVAKCSSGKKRHAQRSWALMQHVRDQRALVNVQNKQIDLQQQAFKQIEKHNTSFATRHPKVVSITPSTRRSTPTARGNNIYRSWLPNAILGASFGDVDIISYDRKSKRGDILAISAKAFRWII